MAGDFTTAANIMKIDYQGPIRDQVNSNTVLYNRLEKVLADNVKQTTQGSQVTVPLRTGRNHGIGMRGTTGATLPTAGNQVFGTTAVYNIQAAYGTLKLEWPALKATRNNTGAFIKLLDVEMNGLIDDMVRDMNRQMLGDGSGVLTLCGTTTASTTVTVTSTAKMEVGMFVDIAATATGVSVTNGQNVEVLTIPSTTTFTVGIAVTTSSSHGVYRTGNYGNEISGIDYITDNADGTLGQGNYGGIDRDTYTWWQGQRVHNSAVNRALKSSLMRDALVASMKNAGASSKGISAIYTNHEIASIYGEMQIGDKRYNNLDGKAAMVFDAGWHGLMYGGIPIFEDKDHAANKMTFVDESVLKIYHMGDWEWADADNVLTKVEGEAAYEAVMQRYLEIGADMCNCHCQLEDLLES